MQLWRRKASLYKALATLTSSPPQFHLCYSTASAAVAPDIDDNDDGSTEKKKKKKKKNSSKLTLYSKISPLGNPSISIASVLDEWVESGKQVWFGELQRITRDLRKRGRFTQALQVSEWMRNYEAFTFSAVEHAVHIDLIGKVHGYLSAESYFNDLNEKEKTEKTYGALLHCYVRQRDIAKSLSHMQSMKEKGIQLTCLVYNDIMSLYTNTGKHEMVPDVLAQMKEDGVAPDTLSYKICLNSYGQRSDIKGMEAILDEMEQQPGICMEWNTLALVAHLYTKVGLNVKANDFLERAEERLPTGDANGYNHLISLHASLGNKNGVLRLWEVEKRCCKRCLNRDYISVLHSLVRISEFEEAEGVLKDWESSGNYFDFRVPYIVVDAYIEKGLYEKAYVNLKDLMNKGKLTAPEKWGRISAGYLDQGNSTRAVECMKCALSFCRESKWKPEPDLIIRLLNVLGDRESKGDIDTLLDTFLTATSEKRRNLSSPVEESLV